MKKFECEPCVDTFYDPVVGDPDSGIVPGTAFEDIPDDWVCPICGLGKDVLYLGRLETMKIIQNKRNGGTDYDFTIGDITFEDNFIDRE